MTEINNVSQVDNSKKGLLKKGYNPYTTQIGLGEKILTQDEVFRLLSSKPGTEKIN